MRTSPKSLIGKRFNLLKVLSVCGRNKSGNTLMLCLCDCGNNSTPISSALISGHSSSCGCLTKKNSANALRKHGMTNTKVYQSWTSMIERCENKNNPKYHRYGGRGIKICKRWRESFQSFYDDMGDSPLDMTLGRRNNNGDYEPSNCRWENASQQSRNTKNNRLLKFKGKTRCLIEWAEEFRIDYDVLWMRLNRGWSIKRALETKVGTK